jgi:hypothetical protein
MKILIISKYGDSLVLGEKLANEKHAVKVYVKDVKIQHPLITPKPSAEDVIADLTIVEDDSSGAFVEKAKELNRPILGGGQIADRLCKDSQFLKGVVEGCGFELSRPETKGMAIDVGGWFNGETFIKPMFFGLRYERFGAGDVGNSALTMGLVGSYKMKGKLFSICRAFEVFLKTNSYRGFVNIKTYINNEKVLVSGVHLGLYIPTVHLLSHLHNSLGGFLFKVATGIATMATAQPDRVCVGVVYLEKLADIVVKRPVVCNSGETIEEAISKTYKLVHKTVGDNAYYRVDIGSNYKQTLSHLKEWEWL